MIPRNNATCSSQGSVNIPLLGTKHNFFFQSSYFLSTIKKWYKLGIDIQKSDSISIFKKQIPSLIRPLPNKVSSSHNSQGLKLLTRLRLGLSHLCYHKFKHNFLDTINLLRSYSSDIETSSLFFSVLPKLYGR